MSGREKVIVYRWANFSIGLQFSRGGRDDGGRGVKAATGGIYYYPLTNVTTEPSWICCAYPDSASALGTKITIGASAGTITEVGLKTIGGGYALKFAVYDYDTSALLGSGTIASTT